MKTEFTYAVALEVNGEQYAIAFTRETLELANQHVGTWAADDRLNFTWNDAAWMVAQMREACGAC